MSRNQREVAVRRIEQFGEIVLDLHVVVSTGKAEAGGGFRGVSGSGVEFCNQRSEIYVHDLLLAGLTCLTSQIENCPRSLPLGYRTFRPADFHYLLEYQ